MQEPQSDHATPSNDVEGNQDLEPKEEVSEVSEVPEAKQTNEPQPDQETLKQEHQRAKTENDRLTSELDRLRNHLLTIEEEYTQELLAAEQREEDLKAQLAEKCQKVENLEAQLEVGSKSVEFEERLQNVIAERDAALEFSSQADDKIQQLTASISNLQLVIEQMQKENERKLASQAKSLTAQIENEIRGRQELEAKCRRLENQVSETTAALEAASRLTEQLDLKEKSIAHLKDEVGAKLRIIDALNQEMDQMRIAHEGKIDKQVIKNLVLGYFLTPNDKRHEVQRLLARVLDFNQEELVKIGLQKPGRHSRQSSISSLLSNSDSPNESIVSQFVHFLEEESVPNTTQGSPPNSSSSSTTAGVKLDRNFARDLARSLANSSSTSKSNPFLARSPLSYNDNRQKRDSITNSLNGTNNGHGNTNGQAANILLGGDTDQHLAASSVQLVATTSNAIHPLSPSSSSGPSSMPSTLVSSSSLLLSSSSSSLSQPYSLQPTAITNSNATITNSSPINAAINTQQKPLTNL